MSSLPDLPEQEKKRSPLSDQEKQLHRALSDKDPRIGKMYLGALIVGGDRDDWWRDYSRNLGWRF